MSRYIPEETIREILDKADIHEVISGYVQLKRAGKRWKGLCPFHNEKTPSFIVNTDMQVFHCFGCGKGGNVFTFLMEKENVDFPEAAHILADRLNIYIPENINNEQIPQKQDQRERLYNINALMAELYSKNLYTPSGKTGLDYLKKRNFTDKIIKQFSIGFAPDTWDYAIKQANLYKYTELELIDSGLAIENEENKSFYDRFRNRITFPISNEHGKIIGFSARTLEANPQGAKYVNSPETPIFKKSRILYGFHLAKKCFHDKKSAILCEGQIDVIAMHRAGFTNAVAPQGTAFTEEQAKLLKRYTNTVYICFDGDTAGINATVKAIEILLPLNVEIKIISLPAGEDPDSIFSKYGTEKIKEYIDNAHDFFSFLFNYYSSAEDSFTPYGKAKIAAHFIKYLLLIENSVLQSSIVSILAQKLAVPENTIKSEMQKKRREQSQKTKNNENTIENTENFRNNFSSEINEVKPINPIIARVEEELLELTIQHGDVGRRLEEELPHDFISDSAVGSALNTAISLTINGEWEFINQELNKFLINNPDKTLSKILTAPSDYPEKFDYHKAVSDCIAKIKKQHIEDKISTLMKQLKDSLSEDKKALFDRITSLQKEKLSLK